MEFFEVISDLDKKKYDQLVQHETQAINAIKKNGLYY
jgi:hypothetical protein